MKPEENRLKSEGKILEITPLLYMPDGTLQSLPPVHYECPGWLLGYVDEYIIGYPYQIVFNERHQIPSDPRMAPYLSFNIRLFERWPNMVPTMAATISEEWIELFAQAVSKAQKDFEKNGSKDLRNRPGTN